MASIPRKAPTQTNGEATSCGGTEAESCAAGRASYTAGRLGACARVTRCKAATAVTVQTSTNKKDRKFRSVFFRIPHTPFSDEPPAPVVTHR